MKVLREAVLLVNTYSFSIDVQKWKSIKKKEDEKRLKAKIAKKLLSVLLATVLVTASLTACGGDGAETTGGNETETGTEVDDTVPVDDAAGVDTPATAASVDFEDGACAFVKMNLLKGTPDESLLSVVDFNGSKALYVENVSGKSMFVGINVSALVGDKIADISKITMDIGTSRADGSFSAVSGYLYAYTGENNDEVKGDDWSVYLESANPKTAVFDVSGAGFVAGADNYIILSKETDNNTASAASLYIDNITFLDASGNVIEADTSVDFGSPAGFESSGKDLSNLCVVTGAVVFEGFEKSGDAWAQDGLDMPQEILDALVPGSVVEIEYTSENGDMWIVMPDSAEGWMRVGDGNNGAAYINNSHNIAQITYGQIAEFCGDDVSTWGARMQCEASGAWEVFSVKVGQKAPIYTVGNPVVFEGFEKSGDAWAQDGLDMPQEVLDALVPGSVVELDFNSESGNLWIVMPDSSEGWMRVGDGNNGSAVCVNGKCYVTYEQIAEFCGDDVSAWGARMQAESDTAWEVYGVRVGTALEMKMVNNNVAFEGFEKSGDAWAQDGLDMPQEILDALVPGSVVTLNFTSESGNLWIVMPDSSEGWMRVGDGNNGTAACNNGACQVTYEQIAEFCGDDVSAWGARMQAESDTAWEVYSVTVGQAAE